VTPKTEGRVEVAMVAGLEQSKSKGWGFIAVVGSAGGVRRPAVAVVVCLRNRGGPRRWPKKEKKGVRCMGKQSSQQGMGYVCVFPFLRDRDRERKRGCKSL